MIEFAAVMTGTRLTGFIITVILYIIGVKWVTIAMKKIRKISAAVYSRIIKLRAFELHKSSL